MHMISYIEAYYSCANLSHESTSLSHSWIIEVSVEFEAMQRIKSERTLKKRERERLWQISKRASVRCCMKHTYLSVVTEHSMV